jgi:TonB-linked SusC/RagA family outer membrane protein
MYYHNKARAMDGLTPIWTADIQNKVLSNDPNSIWGETDWLDKIFQTGQTQQHNISASGGTQRTKYYASLGIMDQEGTLINTGYTRYNMRANLDVQVAKNLRFSANLSGSRADTDWPGFGWGVEDGIAKAITTVPVIKSEYKGMPTGWHNSSDNNNGYAAFTESGFMRQTSWNMDSNFKLEYDFSGLTDILKGLKAAMFAAYNYNHTAKSQYTRYFEMYTIGMNLIEEIGGPDGISQGSEYWKSSSWGDTWMVRPQVDYAREFGRHYVSALLFYEARKDYSSAMDAGKYGYYSDDPVDLALGSSFFSSPVNGSHSYSGQASYAGRFNYVFDKKYLAEIAFRYDGSYVFAPENRWGFFPSASVGWVASEEDFFSNLLPVVDYFKVRLSYGQSGNDNVTPYLYNSTFNINRNSMVLGNEVIAQYYSENPYIYRNLTWATTHSYNIGMEADLWHKKLGVELDLFYKLTTDILETQSGNYPPSLGGYFPSYQNSGEVENKGFEITLKHENRINSDWRYAVSGNFSFARNRVLKRAITDDHPSSWNLVGGSMGGKYGFIALGLFQTQEEVDQSPAAPSGGIIRPGNIKYLDVNGDGILSWQYDHVRIGYGEVPEINFSLNMSVSWKDFYATLLWQGVTHCDYELSGLYDSGVVSSTNYTSLFAEGGNTPYYLVEDAWTPENPNARWPRLSTQNAQNDRNQSTWWLINGEYLRLKNAHIGYNVPEKYLRKTPFTRINVYLAGTNLLTFSHFKYVDPEAPSVNNGYCPQQQTFSLGLNVTF